MEMKARGCYVARQLTFHGAEFDTHVTTNTT